MSTILATRVKKPAYFHIAPLLRGRGHRKVVVIGFDSEASKGRPFLFQFSLNGDESNVTLREVPDKPSGGLSTFIQYLDDYCKRKDTEYIIFGWNLSYEWTQLWQDLPAEITSQPKWWLNGGVEDNPLSNWHVDVLNDKR